MKIKEMLNIYTFEDIKTIRKRAYVAFFLLGSSFLFDITEFLMLVYFTLSMMRKDTLRSME